jgi:F0F1-type ATP synthase membrane subunit c/vacuolar-type H+-ATPase subunit K
VTATAFEKGKPAGHRAMDTATPRIPPLVPWFIWLALLGSVVLYAGILTSGLVGETPEEGPPEGLILPLGVAGFVSAVASLGVRHVVRSVKDASGRRKLPAWAFPAFVVALALAETPGIFGFVLGVTGHAPKDYLPLFAISLAALATNYPAAFLAAPRED